MTLKFEADELLRATKKALAETEAKLKFAQARIVRRDAEDAITRSGASASAVLAHNMAAVGRVAANGIDVEYDCGGRWLDRDGYIAALKRDSETSRFFAGALPKKSPSSLEPNPFSRSSWNLTEQMREIRSNPDRAAQLRREAD